MSPTTTAHAGLAFHDLLRQARVEGGLTQRQAADRLGLTQSQVSLYEAGLRRPPLDRAWGMLMAFGWEMSARRIEDPADTTRVALGFDPAGNRRYWSHLDGPLVLLGGEALCRAYLMSLSEMGDLEPVADVATLERYAYDRRRVVLRPEWEVDERGLDQNLTVVQVQADSLLLSVGGQRVPLT